MNPFPYMDYYLGKVFELLPVILVAGIICVIVLWKKGRRVASCRGVSCTLFVCYLAGLLAVSAVPSNLWTHIWYVLRYHSWSGITFRFFTFECNLIPDFWRDFGLEHLGNLLLYVPFGFLVPLLWRGVEGWKIPALGFALCLCIEIIQLFIGRSLDANDLILNTAGAAVGCLLFFLLRVIFPNFVQKCQETQL